LRSFFALFLILSCAASSATALADVYEGFAYPSGTSVNGLNGGTGWGGAWNNSFTVADLTTGPGLTYQNLATTPGGSIAATPGQVVYFYRPLADTYGADNTTEYLSFLLQPETGFGFYGGVNFGGVFVGKSGKAGVTTYGIEGPVNDIDSSSVVATAGTTVFLVLEAQFLPGDDIYSLYVDPTPGAPQPATPDAVKTDVDSGTSINSLVINNGGLWATDEIRIGPTFASVTPVATTVPEPGSAVLLVFGILALALGARRRSAQDAIGNDTAAPGH
jgi:hypothetical protein